MFRCQSWHSSPCQGARCDHPACAFVAVDWDFGHGQRGLDPWHMSSVAVGMWASPSRLPLLAERHLPADFVGIFFNVEFYFMVFLNDQGLQPWG